MYLAAQERSLQEGIRARRALLGRRRCHYFRSVYFLTAAVVAARPTLTQPCYTCGDHRRTPLHLFLVSTSHASTCPEERPGHHVKLYQYCSGDVDGMVQRHLHVCPPFTVPSSGCQSSIYPPQFDGERDLKTPSDFSNTKADEANDDDDEVEDDDGASRSPVKKPTHPVTAGARTGPSSSTHGNIPIRPAQSNSHIDVSVLVFSRLMIVNSFVPLSLL